MGGSCVEPRVFTTGYFQGFLHRWLAHVPFGGRVPHNVGFLWLPGTVLPVRSQGEICSGLTRSFMRGVFMLVHSRSEKDPGSSLDFGGWHRRPGDAQVGMRVTQPLSLARFGDSEARYRLDSWSCAEVRTAE